MTDACYAIYYFCCKLWSFVELNHVYDIHVTVCTYGINSVDSIYIILFSIYTTVHMPGIIDWNIEIQILI